MAICPFAVRFGLLFLLVGTLLTTAAAQTTDALIISNSGSVGMGTSSPARQLHLVGSNAVFRMDRSAGSAAFLMVRTNSSGNPLKTYVLGTNASGSNNGEFVINDLGTAVSGAGTRRMTITDAGNVVFTGWVQATNYFTPSSRQYKENVEPLTDALTLTEQLQGVRFVWKDTGQPAVGLIAEEVAAVMPEVVKHEEDNGQALGVNYPALVAVLVEAVKAQQTELAALRTQVAALTTAQARLTSLEARLAALEGQTPSTQQQAAWVTR